MRKPSKIYHFRSASDGPFFPLFPRYFYSRCRRRGLTKHYFSMRRTLHNLSTCQLLCARHIFVLFLCLSFHLSDNKLPGFMSDEYKTGISAFVSFHYVSRAVKRTPLACAPGIKGQRTAEQIRGENTTSSPRSSFAFCVI